MKDTYRWPKSVHSVRKLRQENCIPDSVVLGDLRSGTASIYFWGLMRLALIIGPCSDEVVFEKSSTSPRTLLTSRQPENEEWQVAAGVVRTEVMITIAECRHCAHGLAHTELLR